MTISKSLVIACYEALLPLTWRNHTITAAEKLEAKRAVALLRKLAKRHGGSLQ